MADDYCNFLQAQSSNAFVYTANVYETWSGRIFTTFIIGSVFHVIEPFQTSYLSAIVAVMFFFSLFCLAGLITSSSRQLMLWAGAAAAFWFGGKSLIAETVFWPTGGIVYAVPISLSLIWLKLLDSFPLNSTNNHRILMLSGVTLLGLLLGTSIELLSPPLIVITFAWATLSNSWGRPAKRSVFVGLVATILGMAVLIAAPGNYVRATYGGDSFKLSALTVFPSLVDLLVRYVKSCSGLLMIGIVVSVLNYVIRTFKANLDEDLRRPGHHFDVLVYFLAALAAVVPMLVIRDFAMMRTSIVFAVFALLFLFSISERLPIWRSYPFLNARSVTALAIILFLTITGGIIGDIRLAIPVRTAFEKRNDYLNNLETNVAKEVVAVEYISLGKPKSLYFNDISPDAGSWINSCVAKYHGLKQVKVQ